MLNEQLQNQKNLYIFAKDKNSVYLFCNETLAEAANLDSPHQIIGKTDKDLYWRKYADLYREYEKSVVLGSTYLNEQVPFTRIENNQSVIITTATALQDKDGYPIGIIGNSVDITGYTLTKNNGHHDQEKNIFYLGSYFGNEYFTKREFEIFKSLLLGKSAEEIALKYGRSVKTIQTQIKSIANKLQCSHKSEIVPKAIRNGLTYVLEEKRHK